VSRPTDQPLPVEKQQTRRELPTWRLITAIAVALAAIVGVIVLASVVNSRPVTDVTDPLPVSSVDAPGASTPACTSLMAALPDPLGALPRRQLVQSDDPLLAGVAAWGEPAVVLRCGVPTPEELTCSSPVQVVDGVAWLPIPGSGGTTYLAVDRPVRVALTVPDGVSTGPWQEMSKIVGSTLTEREICSDGVPVPPDGG
jgi:Protein of unknown function (DUF3515)